MSSRWSPLVSISEKSLSRHGKEEEEEEEEEEEGGEEEEEEEEKKEEEKVSERQKLYIYQSHPHAIKINLHFNY